MYLSETYLDSTTPIAHDKLRIPVYTLICYDHPFNITTQWSLKILNKFVLLRVINIAYLQKCPSFELQIGDKICIFVVLCRSPSQSQDDFGTLGDNFEMTLEILAQKILL